MEHKTKPSPHPVWVRMPEKQVETLITSAWIIFLRPLER